MATTPLVYVREGQDTWHIVIPDTDTGLTLCGQFPVKRWDQETTERPVPLCQRCDEIAIPLNDARPVAVEVHPDMSSIEYLAQGTGFEAIAKLHKATKPVHLAQGCALCQSLYERRAELVARYFGPNGPPGRAAR